MSKSKKQKPEVLTDNSYKMNVPELFYRSPIPEAEQETIINWVNSLTPAERRYINLLRRDAREEGADDIREDWASQERYSC